MTGPYCFGVVLVIAKSSTDDDEIDVLVLASSVNGFKLSASTLSVVLDIGRSPSIRTAMEDFGGIVDAFAIGAAEDDPSSSRVDSSKCRLVGTNADGFPHVGFIAPLSARRIGNLSDKLCIWRISDSSSTRPNIATVQDESSHGKEAFCIEGNAQTCHHIMNWGLPMGAACLWRPTDELHSDIDVWNLRSGGLLGVGLSLEMMWDGQGNMDVGTLGRRLLRMKRPCSSMDYPP